MIRVLHILGGMNQGGVENFLMNLYRNIDRNKVQFDYLVNRKGIFDEEIRQLGGKIYILPALQKIGQTKYTRNLDDFFKEHNEYKIVHSHLNQVTGLILERAKKAGIPVRIAHSHNSQSSKNLLVRAYKHYLGKKILLNATDLFACSEMAGKWLFGCNVKFSIINNAIELKKYEYNAKIRRTKRKELNIREDTFVIGNVARLSYQKNQIFLLKIFNEVHKKIQNSQLIIVGKGNEKNKLLKYIKKNNLLECVMFLEDRKDVNKLLQTMDYFVFPSRFEGLGISLIEAQATGLKCIATKGKIPKETKITDSFNFCSLNKGSKKWANIIIQEKDYKRNENDFIKVKEAGYDVMDTVTALENLYIQYYRRKE